MKQTQEKMILGFLSSGRTLTQLQAYHKFDCWALSSRVSDLNKAGHKIDCELVKVGKKYVGKYSIKK